jgi:alkanesulfonate monooxygenase SsuD/methylene tetrahydromethanopterin reductase-like flavin-dependent oxidoreductase (luciferase family)
MIPLDSPASPKPPARSWLENARAGNPTSQAGSPTAAVPEPDDAEAGEPRLARDAARAAGRDPESVEVACVVHCCLSDDPAAAAEAARAVVPRYVLHPAVPRLFGELDGGFDLGGVRELTLAGDRAGAAGMVPQPVADGFVAWGEAGRVATRLAEYRAAGVDLPVIFPMPVGGDWGYERTIAALGI